MEILVIEQQMFEQDSFARDQECREVKEVTASNVIHENSALDDEAFRVTSSVSVMHASRKRGSAEFPEDAYHTDRYWWVYHPRRMSLYETKDDCNNY